jgi:hypothetical protein
MVTLKLILSKRSIPAEGRRSPVVAGKIGNDFFERDQNRLDTLRQLIVLERLVVFCSKFSRYDGANDL